MVREGEREGGIKGGVRKLEAKALLKLASSMLYWAVLGAIYKHKILESIAP